MYSFVAKKNVQSFSCRLYFNRKTVSFGMGQSFPGAISLFMTIENIVYKKLSEIFPLFSTLTPYFSTHIKYFFPPPFYFLPTRQNKNPPRSKRAPTPVKIKTHPGQNTKSTRGGGNMNIFPAKGFHTTKARSCGFLASWTTLVKNHQNF